MSLILYVRVWFCSKFGELSIFRRSLVKDFPVASDGQIGSLRTELVVLWIPGFGSIMDGFPKEKGETCTLNVWKTFFEKYLEQDGIYIYTGQDSMLPDILIRVTDDTSDSRSQRVYLIGISLENPTTTSCSVGLDTIQTKVSNFLYPVCSQLKLEENNITVLQLIVSNLYSATISRVLGYHQDWVLNSGVYYEDVNDHIVCCPIDSNSVPEVIKQEWITVPPHCQVVVCSKETLEEFLGFEFDTYRLMIYGDRETWLEEPDILSKLLEISLVDLIKRVLVHS